MSSARRGGLRAVLPYAVCLAAAAAILAPAFRPGVIVAYDMPWSPDARWTPFSWGIGTPAPRAVPSDAVAVLLGKVLGGGLAQLLILLAILTGLGTGAVALLRTLAPRASSFGQVSAGLAALWNPYVGERLVVGQWTVLLGAALVPWVVRAGLRENAGGSRLALVGLVGLAGVGGANSVVLVAIPALLSTLVPRPRWGSAGAVVAAAFGVAAVWALPALVNTVASSAAGASAFAATADSPVGVLGSLLAGGGNWNTASHLTGREPELIAAVSAALALGCAAYGLLSSRSRTLLASLALIGLGFPLASVYAAESWTWITLHLPGGGLLRDSQKFVVWWVVVVAVGAGLAADRIGRTAALGGAPVAVLVMALPVALLPSLAWGVSGRIGAVEVPDAYRTAAASASRLEPGLVGLLPWNQYRRYAWNGTRISLTLAPRIIDQDVLFDDSLPLVDGRVPGEDARAAAVTQAIADGASPGEALVAAGVRYVALERRTGLPEEDISALGPLVVQSAELEVREVGGPGGAAAARLTRAAVVGWAVTAATWLVILVMTACRGLGKLPVSLLRSRP